MPVAHKQLTDAEIQLCNSWVKFYATPREHYVNNVENGIIIHDYMNEVLGGVYTFDGLTSALEANRSNNWLAKRAPKNFFARRFP